MQLHTIGRGVVVLLKNDCRIFPCTVIYLKVMTISDWKVHLNMVLFSNYVSCSGIAIGLLCVIFL